MKVDIGIIGALSNEVEKLISAIENRSKESVSGIDFYTGTLDGKCVVVAKCGVGKVYAAMCAEAMIIKYSPKIIINTGVAGALKSGIKTLDVVIATSLVQHDMDTTAVGDPRGMIMVGTEEKIFFEADTNAQKVISEAADELSLTSYSGPIASADKFVASREEKEEIRELFGAYACEMEGASIAQVAYVNSVPFAVIRAISDSADTEATMDFPTFMPLAAENSTALTRAFIKKINL